MLRAVLLAAVVSLAPADAAFAQSPSPQRKHLLGQRPPELVAVKEQWLAGPPVSLEKLKGQVVWLQFNF